MFLLKQIFFTYLILYEIHPLVNSQEYLKDLKPQDIKFNAENELPPVELPRPMLTQRQSRSLNDDSIEEDDLMEEKNHLQKSQRPTLMDLALELSVREGLNAMRRLYTKVEPDMVKNGQLLQDNHPAALLSKFSAPVVETSRREMAAYATLTATKAFRKNYDLHGDLARQAHNQKVSLRRTALESLCPPRDAPTCMPAAERYRTHDGTCNNKKRLRWGAAQMPFNRFLPPEYGDGVDTTRKAIDGGHLSSSRFVSLLVHGARDGEAPLTLMLAQWGQLLDHDLTSTAQPRSINGSVPSCCGSKDFHPSCFPIKVPLDDPWLSPLKVRCLEFLRSAPAQRRDCVLSWREQTNQATSYIDASPIYSSSVKSSDNARTFRKGLLIFGRGNPADDVCQRGAIATHCIRSGDGRSGEQPGLLALHHVWVHEHNHIAMKLSEINLHWSDEKIYQETRRIIGAMFQHITYREFLPIVLGREVMKLFDLELLSTGYYEGYDPKVNPTVANAFAAAAFRFGHSLIQNSYMRCDRFHNIINNNVSLHEEFQRGDIGSVGSLHRLLRGMANQRALKRDEFITPELTNHLFQTPGFPFGLDLAAINIQRGRDHGIPQYTHWRVPCGLTPINTWEEFAVVVGPESARRISHAYHSVHDIDLFVGGIAERPVVGGLVGPTFACIIAQQFSNSRKGDRFWYENPGFESSFTPAQLHSIRKVSLASVLCRTVGGGTFQPHIFLPPQFPNNERLPCGVGPLGDFDISPWLEQDPFASLNIAHTATQQPAPPTFKPQTSMTFKTPQPSLPTFKPRPIPDRIFDIMQMETKSPDNTDSPLSDNKVGFSNRITTTTLNKPVTGLNQKQQLELIANPTNVFLIIRNTTKVNDKLDLKKKGNQGQVTKQKPVPAVNNKLDKNSNKPGGNRHGAIQSTTRRTIIVNNIPIELRSAGVIDKPKTVSKKKDDEPEARIGNTEIATDKGITKKKGEGKEKDEIKAETREANKEEVTDQNTTKSVIQTDEKPRTETTKKEKITEKPKIEKEKPDDMNDQQEMAKMDEMKTHQQMDKSDNLKQQQQMDKSDNLKQQTNKSKKRTTDKENEAKHEQISPILTLLATMEDRVQPDHQKPIKTEPFSETEKEKQTEVIQKILSITKNFQNSELKNVTSSSDLAKEAYDADIDPMAQATPHEHKRVQRKLVAPAITDQIKNKLKLNTLNTLTKSNVTFITTNINRTMTTKTPKPGRTTTRTLELRQYQKRPSYTKTPPPHKVIVDTVNGDNQYEIEINIRQTNKSPKPQQTTSFVGDITNGYKPNQIDRYTSYQTTPIYAYYQPAPTQISDLTQNQRTKPPTIIFVNEHEERMTTRKPGFLQSIIGWNSGTKRPLPASIEFNERPGNQNIIGSPHSTANLQTGYQNIKPPVSTSSFSQAQVGPAGIVQASSGSVSNGNFGTIAGFASANGADSTFSFNIRPKPDKAQNIRPATGQGGSYGLALPPGNPWYPQNTDYSAEGQHISGYDLPYRENINTPFSTSNSQTYYIRKKHGPQRKEALPLTKAQNLQDYDYIARTLQPLHNITADKESEDKGEDYEYDEDYGTSPLLRKFNQDGYLRPEHMIATVLKATDEKTPQNFMNSTEEDSNKPILDDNYVLPVLNGTQDMPHDLPKDLPKPLNTNFSVDFPDTMGKRLNNDIFAEEDQQETMDHDKHMETENKPVWTQNKPKRNKNRNKLKSPEKIAFAPLNILTKPERPDNWVFFDSPQEDDLLPKIPEINMDPVPSAEIPKPIKENIWLELIKIKQKQNSETLGPLGHLTERINQKTDLTTDNNDQKDGTTKDTKEDKDIQTKESTKDLTADNTKDNQTHLNTPDKTDTTKTSETETDTIKTSETETDTTRTSVTEKSEV
ncbi:uncharacterized protein ACRADG_003298 [Cochliomyia hominivorax]